MFLYLGVTTITIAIGCQIQNRTKTTTNEITRQQLLNKIYMAAIFSILFLLAALRLEVGNDYGTYVVTGHEIFKNGYVVTEPGYNFVVKALYTLSGKEDYLLMFAVFAFATTFIFLKCFYEQSESFALTFFLFMTLGIYFRSFNTVRYYFVLAITLYSMRYVVKKEYVKFILLILLAALFHKSVLVVIPIYILANRKIKRWQYALLVMLSALIFICREWIMKLALILYPSYANTSYLENTGGLSEILPAVFRCLIILFLCIVFYKSGIKESETNRLYFNLNIFAILMYVCGSFIPLLSRFTYYLITAQILLIPGVITSIQNKKKKKIAIFITVAIALAYFALFLKTAALDGVRVLPYKTWLFYEKEWLDATKIF